MAYQIMSLFMPCPSAEVLRPDLLGSRQGVEKGCMMVVLSSPPLCKRCSCCYRHVTQHPCPLMPTCRAPYIARLLRHGLLLQDEQLRIGAIL